MDVYYSKELSEKKKKKTALQQWTIVIGSTSNQGNKDKIDLLL